MAVFGALPASLAVSGRHVPGDVMPPDGLVLSADAPKPMAKGSLD
jgi:hypothetical protein